MESLKLNNLARFSRFFVLAAFMAIQSFSYNAKSVNSFPINGRVAYFTQVDFAKTQSDNAVIADAEALVSAELNQAQAGNSLFAEAILANALVFDVAQDSQGISADVDVLVEAVADLYQVGNTVSSEIYVLVAIIEASITQESHGLTAYSKIGLLGREQLGNLSARNISNTLTERTGSAQLTERAT